jgi:alkylation response protein AidB-like acyl-CoA dehydrogenase
MARGELSLEVLGHQGLGWGGEQFSADEQAVIKYVLRSKAGAIAGGSWEVQLNIISKRILGLPETTQKG